MICLYDACSVASALGNPDLDAELRALIGYRIFDALFLHEAVLGTDFRLFVIEAGDIPDVINRAVGFNFTGHGADLVEFFSVEDHGLYLEAAYVPDDGPHTRLFLRNDDGLEMGLHYRCLVALDGDGE